jgi:glycosyltransferase involved in cell wall biosynthesis
MLTKDRPELAAKAVECFRKQTYPVKALYLQDFGVQRFDPGNVRDLRMCLAWDAPNGTIGSNRNAANKGASGYQFRNQTSAPWLSPDIFIHWDDDDWSHPNRIAEQVAFLQASGADAVGFNEMLFWRTFTHIEDHYCEGGECCAPQAWLYSHPRPDRPLGTSLCYWRKTWERKPFADGPKPGMPSEFFHWFRELKVVAVSSLERGEPRMVARIHGANFGTYDLEGLIAGGSREWKRVPDWDERIRSILA